MRKFLLQRLIQSIVLLFGVVIIVFFLVRLTGDPASLMVARNADTAQIQEVREAFGFDRPLIVQLGDYLGGIATGDLGISFRFRAPTNELILERLPETLQLAVAAIGIAVVVAIPLGILGGTNPGKPVDTAARLVGIAGQATPNFWLIMLLIIYFSVKLQWFPTFGTGTWRHLVLPAFALSVGAMGQFVRLTRSAVLEIRNEDYIRTARSKGLSRYTIASKHVARNASLALISVVGVQFTYAMAGSIYIEQIYARPGLGNLLNEAVRARDFPLVQAITIVLAAFAIGMNFLTDVAYSIADPRIRHVE